MNRTLFEISNKLMKPILVGSIAVIACCSDDNSGSGAGENQVSIEDKTIAGVSEKGPFVNGSTVKIYELSADKLELTGLSYPGKIASDHGDFRFTHVNLASQYALLEVNGFYRNEVSGTKSAAPITLNALVDFSDRRTANINLLTHLAYERMQYLVDDGISVFEAKRQAEKEILEAFSIKDSVGNFEDLSIFESGDGNAVLLAISILMQGDLAEADFTSRLANFAYDIEKDGMWNDSVTAAQIADWAGSRSEEDHYASIRKNITDWNLSATIPPFETVVDKFWWNNFGLGDCNKETEGEIRENKNKKSVCAEKKYRCKDERWTSLMSDNWSSFSDAEYGGESVVDMESYCDHVLLTATVGKLAATNGGIYAGITYTFNEDSSAVDYSKCAAFEYSFKGDAHKFIVESSLITDDDYYTAEIDGSTEWKTQLVLVNSLQKQGWGMESQGVSLEESMKNVFGYAWEFTNSGSYTLAVKDIKCLTQNDL